MQVLQYLINGLSIGAVYAIIALGYTMVYGIAKMLNFAHGDVIMVGAYISFCVTNYLGLPAIVSVAASMAVCTLLGIVIEGLALMTPFDANASDEATKSFVAKYTEKMGKEPNQFGADAYDCVYAIYAAANAAGLTGEEAATDICVALVEQFNTMSFDGLTGKGMTWDENGMISKIPAAVVITDGIYVPMA